MDPISPAALTHSPAGSSLPFPSLCKTYCKPVGSSQQHLSFQMFMCVCLYMCTGMFHRTHVEKRTTSGGGSLLLLCGPNRLNSDMSGLVAGTFTSENHLTSLEVHFPHHVHLCPCCSKKEEPYMDNPSLDGKFSVLFDPLSEKIQPYT